MPLGLIAEERQVSFLSLRHRQSRVSGVNSLTQTGGKLLNLGGGTFNATALNNVGSSVTPIRTTAGSIVVSTGAGGAFITESDGASFTGNATGAGAISVINLAGPLTINGATSTVTGNISLDSADDLTLNANLNAGSGTITLRANSDGAGGRGFTQATAAIITTTNATTSAFSLIVNTGGGGSGNAVIGRATIGSATVGTYAVNSNGGSILWQSGLGAYTFQANYGSTITAVNLNLTATGAGAIGSSTDFIQVNVPDNNRIATLSAGSGGIFLASNTTPGGLRLTVNQAVATGAGNITLVSNSASGHALRINGTVASGSGAIRIVADDDLILETTALIGGPGYSGPVRLQGNFDGGSTQTVTMVGNAAVVTSNTGPNAVSIEQSSSTNVNTATLQNVTTGNGGTITVNVTAHSSSLGAGLGGIAMGAGKLLDAGQQI